MSIEVGLEEWAKVRERVEWREKCKGTFLALGKNAGAKQRIEDGAMAQMQGTESAWGGPD